MAFGDRSNDVQAGYVPRVDGGNTPVSSAGNMDMGFDTLTAGLAKVGAAGASAKRDMEFGQGLADGLEVITNSKFSDPPVETARKISELTSVIARRYGADAATQANGLFNNAMKATSSYKTVDASKGIFAVTDDKGNILQQIYAFGDGTENMVKPQSAADLTRETMVNRTAYLSNVATQYSSAVNTVMSLVGPALEQQPEGTFHVQRAVGESYTAFRKIEGWQQRVAEATNAVPNVEALAQFKKDVALDIRGSAISAIQSLVNDSFLNAARGTESLDPALMSRMGQGFVTDWFNAMDETGMFTALGLDPAEERTKLQAVADKTMELFKAEYEGDLTRVKRVEATLAATEGALKHQAVLALPKEKRDEILLSDKLLAAAQTRQAQDLLNNQQQSLGGPRDRWEAVNTAAMDINPTANLQRMWQRQAESDMPFASPTSMIGFLESINLYIDGSKGALWGDISKYITENKAKLIKKGQEFDLDLSSYFDNQPELDKAFEGAITSLGMTVEEFRSKITESEEVAREIQYYNARKGR